MLGKVLPPKNDEVFLALFSNPENKERVLVPFLKCILKLPNMVPNDVQILDPRLHIGREDEKHPIVDALIETPEGFIHIEMQYRDYEHIRERVVYYHSRLLGDQLPQGHGYNELKRTISLLITDFPLIEEEPNYFNRYVFMNPSTHTVFSDISEIDTLELLKLPDASDGSPEWIWGSYINGEKEEDFMRLAEAYPEVQSAVKALYELSADQALRMRADAIEKARRDEEDWRNTLLKKGFAQGIEEGIKEGLEEGREEAKTEMVRNLLNAGIPVDVVARAAAVSIDKVNEWAATKKYD